MLVGVVPRVGPVYSKQSAKSVYPVAIANCKVNRYVYHTFILCHTVARCQRQQPLMF